MARSIVAHRRNMRRARRASGGFSLVEVILALGIMTMAIVTTLMAVYGSHRKSQQTAMEITARNAIRGQIEEVLSVGAQYGPEFGEVAQGVLYYYCTDSVASSSVAPNPALQTKTSQDGYKLIVRFPIPESASSVRRVSQTSDTKALMQNAKAEGVMTIYLDETEVGPDALSPNLWADLGQGTGNAASGFDMDGNGKIEAPAYVQSGLMALLRTKPQETGVSRLPIDLRVSYYNNASHERELFSVRRRIVVGNGVDMSALFDGGGLVVP